MWPFDRAELSSVEGEGLRLRKELAGASADGTGRRAVLIPAGLGFLYVCSVHSMIYFICTIII